MDLETLSPYHVFSPQPLYYLNAYFLVFSFEFDSVVHLIYTRRRLPCGVVDVYWGLCDDVGAISAHLAAGPSPAVTCLECMDVLSRS